jgi:hypothetical protein
MAFDLEEIAIKITAGAHATPPRSSEMAWPSPSRFRATSSSVAHSELRKYWTFMRHDGSQISRFEIRRRDRRSVLRGWNPRRDKIKIKNHVHRVPRLGRSPRLAWQASITRVSSEHEVLRAGLRRGKIRMQNQNHVHRVPRLGSHRGSRGKRASLAWQASMKC